MRLSMPILLDSPRNSVARRYDALPSRLYVVDAQGRIAFKGATPPGGIDAPGAVRALDALVQRDESRRAGLIVGTPTPQR